MVSERNSVMVAWASVGSEVWLLKEAVVPCMFVFAFVQLVHIQ